VVALALPENLIPITKARIPGRCPGKFAHIQTIHRLILHGVIGTDGDRVRLRAWKVAGAWHTTEQEVARFLDAMRSDRGDGAEHCAADADAVGRKLELFGC